MGIGDNANYRGGSRLTFFAKARHLATDVPRGFATFMQHLFAHGQGNITHAAHHAT